MTEPVIDLPELLERVQDDKELLLELMDIYTDDYKKKIILLEAALKENKFEEVRNIAHSLKGASANISAKNLRANFYELENMGKNSNITGHEAIMIQAKKNYTDLEKRIGELKQELK